MALKKYLKSRMPQDEVKKHMSNLIGSAMQSRSEEAQAYLREAYQEMGLPLTA